MSKLTNQTYRGSLFHEVIKHHAKAGRALHPQAGAILSQRTLARRLAEEQAGRELRASEVSNYWRKRALDEIVVAPGRWARLELQKVARILHPGDPNDMYPYAVERSHYLSALYLPLAGHGLKRGYRKSVQCGFASAYASKMLLLKIVANKIRKDQECQRQAEIQDQADCFRIVHCYSIVTAVPYANSSAAPCAIELVANRTLTTAFAPMDLACSTMRSVASSRESCSNSV